MEPQNLLINTAEIRYYGRIPSRKRVFIAAAYKSSKACQSLYISAVEAVRSGYDLFFIPFSENADAIEAGILDSGGRLNYILPSGLGRTSRKTIYKALITSGCALSAEEDSQGPCRASVMRAKSLGAYIADAIIIADDTIRRRTDTLFADEALDQGKDLAVLRDALSSSFVRKYAESGAQVIGSFSDFLLNPRCYLYSRSDGHYNFKGEKFDIMRVIDD